MSTRKFILCTISASTLLITLLILPNSVFSTSATPPASLMLGLSPALPLGTEGAKLSTRDLASPAESQVLGRSPADTDLPATAGVEAQPRLSREIPVALKNVNSGEIGTFTLSSTGEVHAHQAAAMARFFACRRSGRVKPMARGVLVLLADVAQKWPGRVIEIVSGYRAPPYGAPHSKHFKGQAIDLRVRGVRTPLVRDFVWREHRGVGVGHYSQGDFLHLDWRPREGDTAWSARGESSRYRYNPRWATKARRDPHLSTGSGSGERPGQLVANAR